MKLLLDYFWPGHVRELENALEYAVVTSEDQWIRPSDLPPHLGAGCPACDGRLAAAVSSTERDALAAAVARSTTSDEAARMLGLSRATFWRKLKKHGISFSRLSSQK
jgi:transcriptional regulator of acetoin/glycerol metabolism